jgi:hypothetical protein
MEKMMNKTKIAAALILSLGAFITPLHAILPPLFQTSQELKAVLDGDRLGKALPSGEPIIDIHKNDKGYEIITAHYHVQANIVYKQTGRPGPAQFEVEFEKADRINP